MFAKLRKAALSMSDIPCMLVACKAEAPDDQREIPPHFHDQVKRSFSTILVQETSKKEPETQKRCLSNMLHSVFARNRGMYYQYLMALLAAA